MRRRRRSAPVAGRGAAAPSVAIALTVALALLATPGAGQEIAGIALDADGRPLPQVPIALHRVGDGTGATVATGATDDDGRFRFDVEAADSAVFFVALRHRNGLYIGPPARAGTERILDYVVRADEGSEVGAITSALSGGGAGPIRGGAGGPGGGAPGAPQTGGAAAVGLVALLAVAVAVVFVTTAPGYRRRQRRGLLIELARLENGLAGSGAGSGAGSEAGDSEADRRRRDALMARLAPRS